MSWQLKNEINNYNRVNRPFDGGGVMVHGGLGPDDSLKLIRLKGTINSEKYITLLKDGVLSYIVNKFDEGFRRTTLLHMLVRCQIIF